MTKIITIISLFILVLCGLVISYFVYPKIIKSVAEEYIKTKIVEEHKNVAKLLNLNPTSDAKNIVDDLLQKINSLPLDLADENKKLREEGERLHDKLTQQEKILKKMF